MTHLRRLALILALPCALALGCTDVENPDLAAGPPPGADTATGDVAGPDAAPDPDPSPGPDATPDPDATPPADPDVRTPPDARTEPDVRTPPDTRTEPDAGPRTLPTCVWDESNWDECLWAD